MNNPEDQAPELSRRLALSKADYAAGLLKAGLGLIPFAGPALTELVNDFIPGQRTDRIVAFVQQLDARLTEFTKDQFASHARTVEGADLIEDGLWMAARALTDERRKAVANLLVKSLTAEELRYAESKKLLQILDELQDPELITLRYFYVLSMGDEREDEFYDLHEKVLEPDTSSLGSPDEELDRGAIYEAHRATLKKLALIQPRSDTELSRLGQMLMRYIGID